MTSQNFQQADKNSIENEIIRPDSTKSSMLRCIFLNDRLSYYRDYIQYARTHGYQVLSLEDFYALKNRQDGKHFILRHDVDHGGKANRKMFELEKDLGVKSVYYFRFSTIDRKLIRDMKEAGFGVGFHFETIADYVKETGHSIHDKNEIDLELMRQRLEQEIKLFEERADCKIISICSHGARENSVLKIANNTITEKQNMTRFGVLFEAYDADLYEHDIDCHIMDGPVTMNYGFAYQDTPYSAMQENRQNIVFLSHPTHWYQNIRRTIGRLRDLFLGKCVYTTERRFKRI